MAEKKGNHIVVVLIITVVIILGIWFVAANFLGPEPEVKAGGKVISMRTEIQELLDEGFVLCSNSGQVVKDMESVMLEAKQIYYQSYYLGVAHANGNYADLTGIIITPANFDSAKKKLTECSIFELEYRPGLDKGTNEITISGTAVKNADADAWTKFFKKHNYPFKSDELKKFVGGEEILMSGIRGRYKYEAQVEGKLVSYVKFQRNVELDYKIQ